MLAFQIDFTLNTVGPLAVGMFAVYFVVIIWTSYREQKRINRILMVDGQPELFLQKMNGFKRQVQGDKFKRLIEINIAAGLIYEGRVDEAVEILESLSLKGFSPMHKGVYYNNLAFGYLMQNRVNESQEIFKRHIGEMLAADRDPMVQSCARCTQAILDYKQRRIGVAHETLDRLLEKDLMPLQQSVVLYYKGLIMTELGKDGCGPIFEESSLKAGNTVFRHLSEIALNSAQ
ncbi:hypothetical protein ADUPG1_007496 [Aduncisulcus paluster]|uniref:Tetratricopeptide repeat protein n=1 Tax=Aduncisulcus paluster TaxID=2918883 RepID=A0ABQ5KQ86_9EUKA|nr:hypothetical protein ADUPG1_007496 [Aduncisulcus paluster]